MKIKYSISLIQVVLGVIVVTIGGCDNRAKSPQEALDRYFRSAIKQDYATTYTCYSTSYRMKVSREEYVRHRKEASVLLDYKVLSLNQDDSRAQAEVLLTFGPSQKLKRAEPVDIKVTEDLIREEGGWKITVF